MRSARCRDQLVRQCSSSDWHLAFSAAVVMYYWCATIIQGYATTEGPHYVCVVNVPLYMQCRTNVEVVEDFCYLGSYLSRTGNCDKECLIRIGKAASVFGRLVNIWKSKNISLAVKIRLYESLVISTLLYGAESWPLSVTQMNKKPSCR